MATAPDPRTVRATAALRGEMDRVSAELHANPELAFAEERAAAVLTGWLAAEGFDVQRGVADLPTAFVATHEGSSPGPRIALLMEYDALPGVGHGCGHNLIGAGGATAAIAALRAQPDHPGTLLAIGTPGEEGGGGKVLMIDKGVFDEVDAALMFHPADRSLMARHGLACAHLAFEFHGIASHAAKNPELGRSALAAMQLFFHAIDMLRQFVPTTTRLHGVITDGGAAPNVVPDHTAATMLVRDTTHASATAIVERVVDAARGAALATGCEMTWRETAPTYAERNNNLTMAHRVAGYLRGADIHLEEPSPDNPAGSSDIGNLSQRLPIIHPYLQIAPRDTPGHSPALRDAAASPHAHDRVQHMVTALAQTALDLLGDPGFFDEVTAEFGITAATS